MTFVAHSFGVRGDRVVVAHLVLLQTFSLLVQALKGILDLR